MADDDATGTGTDMAPPADAPPATEPTPGADTAPSADLAAEVEKWRALARKHEKQAKENKAAAEAAAKRQADLAKVAEALGLKTEAEPSADAITQQLAAARAEAQQRALELAVLRRASAQDVDADALLDSRAFLQALDGIEATDTEAIDDAIKAAVKSRPTLAKGKTAPAAQQQRQVSGGEFGGAPGGQRQWTADDVARATPAQVADAMSKGLLQQYMSS